jgi:hypothetical protein
MIDNILSVKAKKLKMPFNVDTQTHRRNVELGTSSNLMFQTYNLQWQCNTVLKGGNII